MNPFLAFLTVMLADVWPGDPKVDGDTKPLQDLVDEFGADVVKLTEKWMNACGTKPSEADQLSIVIAGWLVMQSRATFAYQLLKRAVSPAARGKFEQMLNRITRSGAEQYAKATWSKK